MAQPATAIPMKSRVLRNHIPFETDGGIGERATIGVIVLGSDQTIEYEFRTLLNIEGVAFYESRIENSATITPETLLAMEDRIPWCTDVILKDVHLDVVAFGCTSASMVIGENRVFERINEIRPDAKCTTPVTAAFSAFRTLDAENIAVLTPYRQDVNEAVAKYIESNGFNVTVFGSFNEEDDNTVALISTDSVKGAAIDLGQLDDVDLVFVSCTNLRVASIVTEIEQAIGKPVTSSNHAMAWHCLRLAGIEDKHPEFGMLYAN